MRVKYSTPTFSWVLEHMQDLPKNTGGENAKPPDEGMEGREVSHEAAERGEMIHQKPASGNTG